MASNELNARVKINVNQAEKALDRLYKKINSINKAVNSVSTNKFDQGFTKTAQKVSQIKRETDKVNTSWSRVNRSVRQTTTIQGKLQSVTHKLNSLWNKSVTSVGNIGNRIRNWATSLRSAHSGVSKFNSLLKTSNNVVSSIGRTLKGLAATYLGIMGAKATIDVADTITSAQNQLNNLEGGNPQLTEEAMTKTYAAAQRSRGSYTGMLSNVGKTMTLAGDSFQNNIDNAIRFQEIMSKAYSVGGASAAEQNSSMYQLVQALGSGILQGDELRSLREGAPLAYKEIEKFAQGVFNTTDSLKDLASEGVITSDIVVAAIMNAEEKINKSFENTQMTFDQAFDQIKNNAVMAFTPVMERLTAILNSDVGTAIINGISKALVILANAILWVFDILGAFFRWCGENWYWLQYVVIAVVSAIIIALGVYVGMAIWAAIQSAIAFIVVHWQLILIIAIIALVVAGFVWLANTCADGCEFICRALMLVGGAVALIGLIIALTTGNIALLVIALVILVVGIVIYYLNYIAGAITWLGGLFKNIGLWIANVWLGVWNWIGAAASNTLNWIRNTALGLWNSIKAIGQNIGIAFENGWIHAQNAFWTFISAVLKGIQWLEPAINAVAQAFGKKGVDISGTISNIEAKKKSTKSYVSVGDAWSSGYNTYSYKDVGDAWSSGFNTYSAFDKGWSQKSFDVGYNWGTGVQNKIGEFGSGIQDKVKGFSDKFSGLGELANMDNLGNFTAGSMNDAIGNALGDSGTGGKGSTGGGRGSGTGLPDPNDPAHALGGGYDPSAINDDIADGLKKLGNIDDNTGSIADNMELTKEDLEYLRKLAASEWKQEFTTAEIKVDMSNYNTVNGDSDLDGIVTKLADRLYEELDAVANGVYA